MVRLFLAVELWVQMLAFRLPSFGLLTSRDR